MTTNFAERLNHYFLQLTIHQHENNTINGGLSPFIRSATYGAWAVRSEAGSSSD